MTAKPKGKPVKAWIVRDRYGSLYAIADGKRKAIRRAVEQWEFEWSVLTRRFGFEAVRVLIVEAPK